MATQSAHGEKAHGRQKMTINDAEDIVRAEFERRGIHLIRHAAKPCEGVAHEAAESLAAPDPGASSRVDMFLATGRQRLEVRHVRSWAVAEITAAGPLARCRSTVPGLCVLPQCAPSPADQERPQRDPSDTDYPRSEVPVVQERVGCGDHAQPDERPHRVIDAPRPQLGVVRLHADECVIRCGSTSSTRHGRAVRRPPLQD